MNVLPQNTVDCSQPGNQTTPIKLLPAITAFAYKLNKHCAAAPRGSLILWDILSETLYLEQWTHLVSVSIKCNHLIKNINKTSVQKLHWSRILWIVIMWIVHKIMCGWWRSEVPPIFLMNPLQCQTLPCCYFMLPPPYLSMSRLQAWGSCLGTRHLVISCCCLLLCAGVGCLYLAITIKLKLLMFGV